MEPAGTNLGRFPSKFLLMVIPGLVASGVVASVLYAVHVSRAPSSSELLTDLTPQGDGLSAEERRDLTRQMLKARRENPEEPAQVRPMPPARPADSGPAEAAAEPPALDGKAAAPKAAADRAPADRTPPDHTAPDHSTAPDRTFGAAPLPVARPAAPPRPRSDAPVVAMPAAPAATSGAVAPPVAPPTQSAPLPLGAPDPAAKPPVTASPSPPVEREPEPRGFAANVFSSLSTFAGTAANATGNTVNWVIDLPGKAISAGGRLLGRDTPTGNQPAGPDAAPSTGTVPPPATAPPRRNL